MRNIDSHAHIWINDPAFPWAVETSHPPQYDAHPEALLEAMQANRVDATVLVQFIDYRWDNRYVARVLKTFPDKFMAVCRVNPQDPAAPDQLSYWTEEHGFRGVRLSPEPGAGGDWFTGPLMTPLFRRAAALSVPVLILTKPSRLPDLAHILERVPEVDVVIDHIADCVDGSADNLQSLLALARYPRVYLKTGHIWVNSSLDYPWRDTHELVKQAYESFGAQRMMWGSDWPLCLKHTTYSQALSYLRDEMGFFSKEDLTWILGRTALRHWPFPELAG
ncbi:MAG: amidohydrolase family protein [Anaerolineae bacterium]